MKATRLFALFVGILLFAVCAHAIDPANFDRPIRVACVGDSITYGMGSKVPYPSHLQTLLGPDWDVGNFGVSGRTLLRKGDFPWWNEAACTNAVAFDPDVVIIMLGTNDTKPQNWVYKDDFISDYTMLIDLFSDACVYLCSPCPVPDPGNWGINDSNVQQEIKMINRLAADKGLELIDMHEALADRPELLPDRVHPNTEGALILAETADTALTGKARPPRVNSYLADHMVLQRDKPIPVWGTATDGTTISVTFAGQMVSTTAQNGKWKAILKPMPANAEPQTMKISNGKGIRTIRDILIGDVWIASGQSNMERQLGPRSGQKEIEGWEEAVATANYPLIRQYQVPRNTSNTPLNDGHGSWLVCSPETAAAFCGVGYFFIRDVYEAQKIPLAMIHTTWGGTPAEAWTSMEKLKTVPAYTELANTVGNLIQNPSKIGKLRSVWLKEKDRGTQHSWWSTDVPAEGWNDVQLPTDFETMGIHNFDGVIWFRKEFDLSEESAGKPATLQLGLIDDSDCTWVNGQLIGKTDGWSNRRTYSIPPGLLKAGRNVIAVQVIDSGSTGGWADGSGDLALVSSTETIPLSGPWQQKIGTPLASKDLFYVRGRLSYRSPVTLFNAMIHPLLPQPIKGIIWYQGESNNDRAEDYEELFAAMVNDWRSRWNQGDVPFLFVQIAPHNKMSPEIREAQRLVLKRLPHTAMVVTTDVGDAEDIHPARKGPVGERLALAARALAYGDTMEYSGPLFKSMTIKDDKVIIHFTHTGSGLVAKGDKLRGFDIAGADDRFIAAQAVIKDDTVVVSSSEVSSPTAVRYGWSNVPDVNLFNREGLPASPFTTE